MANSDEFISLYTLFTQVRAYEKDRKTIQALEQSRLAKTIEIETFIQCSYVLYFATFFCVTPYYATPLPSKHGGQKSGCDSFGHQVIVDRVVFMDS